jgi:hypothetical protein
MSAILVLSKKCNHCVSVVKFVRSHDLFTNFIKYHDVNVHGIPKGYGGIIKTVPTLILQNGSTIAGAEQIINNLTTLLPQDALETEGYMFGNMGACLTGDDDAGDFCDINSFGGTIKPRVSEDLLARTELDVSEAYNSTNNR